MVGVGVEFIVINDISADGYWIIGEQRYDYLKPAAMELMRHVAWDYNSCMSWLLDKRNQTLGE